VLLKSAKKGINQLLGALRPSAKAIWCEHPRRGRVEFPAGLPPITHVWGHRRQGNPFFRSVNTQTSQSTSMKSSLRCSFFEFHSPRSRSVLLKLLRIELSALDKP
jgi:hypothetical protein